MILPRHELGKLTTACISMSSITLEFICLGAPNSGSRQICREQDVDVDERKSARIMMKLSKLSDVQKIEISET